MYLRYIIMANHRHVMVCNISGYGKDLQKRGCCERMLARCEITDSLDHVCTCKVKRVGDGSHKRVEESMKENYINSTQEKIIFNLIKMLIYIKLKNIWKKVHKLQYKLLYKKYNDNVDYVNGRYFLIVL